MYINMSVHVIFIIIYMYVSIATNNTCKLQVAGYNAIHIGIWSVGNIFHLQDYDILSTSVVLCSIIIILYIKSEIYNRTWYRRTRLVIYNIMRTICIQNLLLYSSIGIYYTNMRTYLLLTHFNSKDIWNKPRINRNVFHVILYEII